MGPGGRRHDTRVLVDSLEVGKSVDSVFEPLVGKGVGLRLGRGFR